MERLGEAGRPKRALRLCPVLPVVFHSGAAAWSTHRTLAELFKPPEALRPWVPVSQPVFWDLAEQPLEALQQPGGAWRKVMAVVRADRLDAATFRAATAAVARDLEALAARDKMRWHNLMCFLVAWGKHRRPRSEWADLDQVTRASITQVALRQEVQTMSPAVEQSWAEWAQEHYTALGEERAARNHLRLLLENRFGPLPETVRQRIEAMHDLNQLEAAFRQSLDIKTLNELKI